jgi:hypothetical protein
MDIPDEPDESVFKNIETDGFTRKEFVTTQGLRVGLPLHKNIFGMSRMYFVVGAILYDCPESLPEFNQ